MKASAAAALALLLFPAVADLPRDLGEFEDPARWRAAPSEGVSLAITRAAGPRGAALRLEYDFHGKAGWAAARREISLDFPEDWEIDFDVRLAAR